VSLVAAASDLISVEWFQSRLLAISESTDVAELGDTVRRAEALKGIAREVDDAGVAYRRLVEVKLRAEYRAGQLLGEMVTRDPTCNTLSQVGVERHQSSRWQRIASIPPAEFDAWLDQTAEPSTSAALKLAKQSNATKGDDTRQPRPVDNLDATPDMFAAIVIDPPWRYDNSATRGAAEDHYGTMTQADLLALELPAADDAHLYCWVTNSFIEDGFELVKKWGFNYKTCLTWCKPQIGMGNYFRSTTEHVLFATRGKQPTLTNNTPTHFTADRKRHSQKPELFYDIVEASSPGPYLEMFARRRRFGWHVWGNEA
jgi:N6-adenosine-specific RNA methylase IME4